MAKKFKSGYVVVLLLAIFAFLVGCEDAPIEPSATNPSQLTYCVQVQTDLALPLVDVKVFVYEDMSQEELVCVGKTNADGEISFRAEASLDYVAVLEDEPIGYTIEPYYAISEEKTVICLSARELTPEEMENHRYSLGDRMLDFSVTDCDGQVYTLSELLKEKRAVVLNFWFINCVPCKMEFPYLQETYERYSDGVAFLALNPVDGTAEEISAFKATNDLTFPMGQCDLNWQSLMGISAYPTTVIVDRNGYICLIHEGMFTDSTMLCNAMDYFLADDYEQIFFESIEQIPTLTGSDDASGV